MISAFSVSSGVPTSKRIRGVLAPVVTPFKADLAPDRERYIRLCEWLISQNCGLAPFGTTSEANSMSSGERMSLLEALVVAGIDPARMMPGTGCCSITETVALTTHAVKHDCAGVLMLPPFYYKGVSEEGLYRYFSEVVQRVGGSRLRIYLYHIPPIAIVGITPKLVERLLKAYPNAIAGMKDSSGDWNNTKTFLDAFSSDGFDVFVGSESFLLANMCNGGAGTISATANVNPGEIDALYAACIRESTIVNRESGLELPLREATAQQRQHAADDADSEQSQIANRKSQIQHRQVRLDLVRGVFSNTKFPSMIAAIKQAIAICANDPEWATVRPPLTELTTEQAEWLAAELQRIGFAMNAIAS